MIFSLLCFGGGVVLGSHFSERILFGTQSLSFLRHPDWDFAGLSTRACWGKAMRHVHTRDLVSLFLICLYVSNMSYCIYIAHEK